MSDVSDVSDVKEVKAPKEVSLFHVLISTATSVAVMATSPVEAAMVAIKDAPAKIDPQELRWVAHSVSDIPFEIAMDEGDAAAIAGDEAPAAPLVIPPSGIITA